MSSKPTIPMYISDDYQREFTATIVNVSTNGIVLDQTCFYPQGGHQAGDKGILVINNKRYNVIEVTKSKLEIVYHKTLENISELKVGDRVAAKIDWDRRYYQMRLHTCQHLLSQIVIELTNLETERANFDYDDSNGGMVKIKGKIALYQWRNIEEEANRRIGLQLTVHRETNGVIHAILINQSHPNHCGGTHIRNLSEIGEVRIIAIEEGEKIFYEIPPRLKFKQNEISWQFHTIVDHIPLTERYNPVKYTHAIYICTKLHQNTELEQENKMLRELLVEKTLDLGCRVLTPTKLGNFAIINFTFLSIKDIKKIFKERSYKDIVFICVGAKSTLCVFSFTDVDAGKVFKHFQDQWSLKGGGKGEFAQGGTIPTMENVTEAIAEELKNLS